MSNLKRYKKDIDSLILEGERLNFSMQLECFPEKMKEGIRSNVDTDEEAEQIFKKLPNFRSEYQIWYTESLSLIKLLVPNRLNDFIKLYEKPKARKVIEYGNYVIEDYLQSLVIRDGFGGEKVGPSAAINQFYQQLNILKSTQRRFESSLFDLKQVIQSDMFDSELDAATVLNRNGFIRGAGAIAGVVLEKHLGQVCENHELKFRKKAPTISDYNDKLKQEEIYETPTWRKIQHLGDLRNLCDHKKETDPTKEDVEELIAGVKKILKTIF